MKKLFIMLGAMALMHTGHSQLFDKLEYFWDQDPGLGQGTVINFTPTANYNDAIAVDPTGLSAGEHRLGMRMHTDDGEWGITTVRRIVVHELVEAEYFWDIDPGVNNATPLVVNTVSLSMDLPVDISTEGVPGGRHLLGMRTKSKGGMWSPTWYRPLTVGTEFYEGEYFWDTDPGYGNATSFALPSQENNLDANVEFDNTGLVAGRHVLYTRVRGLGGSYGLTHAKTVYISRIVNGGEYFWDTDPGVGNGTPLGTISIGSTGQVCDDVSTVGLTEGIHYLYVRTVSEDNVWSVPTRVEFTVFPNTIYVGCPGDYNRDGVINTSDLLSLLAGFGTSGDCTVDLNGDFTVNTSDLLIFLSLFGSTC